MFSNGNELRLISLNLKKLYRIISYQQFNEVTHNLVGGI